MDEKHAGHVRARQDPLRRRYRKEPGEAMIVDCACTVHDPSRDAFHGRVVPGGVRRTSAFDFGIHHAVGGDHDLANPGDLLCAALASCFDATLRMIAERMGIVVESLRVETCARVDVRGTLAVAREVSVGFQCVRCHVLLKVASDTTEYAVEQLLQETERSCVVLQTLRAGVHVATDVDGLHCAPAAEATA